jgi:hypothetical protein
MKVYQTALFGFRVSSCQLKGVIKSEHWSLTLTHINTQNLVYLGSPRAIEEDIQPWAIGEDSRLRAIGEDSQPKECSLIDFHDVIPLLFRKSKNKMQVYQQKYDSLTLANPTRNDRYKIQCDVAIHKKQSIDILDGCLMSKPFMPHQW